jgi:iron(II)-dependent oxidoreductase
MARIFISYRRKDSAALATLLAKELGRQGIKTFVDTRSIDGGGPFPDRLRRAIAECDVFVCLLGATTLNSDWVREEIKHAHTLNKILIPVFQETYTPPDPIPDEHVYALLQSDGITILDMRNLFVDQSIADLAQMIRQSVPRRLPRVLLVAAALLFIVAAAAILIPNIIPSPPTGTPSPTTTAASIIAGNPTTDAPTDTPTPRPTHTPVPTLSPEQLALTPVTRNAAWTPVERDFDGVTMVLVPAGCFMMGSNNDNEKPVHEQCFEAPFWIDKYEVTQGQFSRLGGSKVIPNYFTGDNRPVENITWFGARDFCELRGMRLPTEAEWEYAARGPDGLVYPWGNEFVAENVVYGGNSNNQTASVGSRPGGVSWVGALDMSGNVWERVSSLYQDYPYSDDDESNIDTSSSRGLRGGSWGNNDTGRLRAAARYGHNNPGSVGNSVGFRCARS